MRTANRNFLALDYGQARIGVALASGSARLPAPFMTLPATETVLDKILDIADRQDVGVIVVGLPRNLSGQDTAQTESARVFAASLQERFSGKVLLQDEALTSHKAKQELAARKRPRPAETVDSLAATYILEDFLAQTTEKDL